MTTSRFTVRPQGSQVSGVYGDREDAIQRAEELAYLYHFPVIVRCDDVPVLVVVTQDNGESLSHIGLEE